MTYNYAEPAEAADMLAGMRYAIEALTDALGDIVADAAGEDIPDNMTRGLLEARMILDNLIAEAQDANR